MVHYGGSQRKWLSDFEFCCFQAESMVHYGDGQRKRLARHLHSKYLVQSELGELHGK